jgi:hypothetical protein
VLPGWWLVTIGEPNTTPRLLCAVFGIAWLSAAVVLARRS